MRRLFHGRMVSVDGHCRRMEANYDKYVIAVNSNIAYSLLNQGRTQNQVGTHLEWVTNTKRLSTLIPIIPGHSYTLYFTKSGYELVLGFYDEDLILKSNTEWQNEAAFVPEDSYLFILVRKVTTTADIAVGEVGLILEDDGED